MCFQSIALLVSSQKPFILNIHKPIKNLSGKVPILTIFIPKINNRNVCIMMSMLNRFPINTVYHDSVTEESKIIVIV